MKEGLFESVRTKLAAVATAVVALLVVLAGLFPELQVIHVDPEKLNALVDFIAFVVAALVVGRSIRNTPTSGGK